MKSVKKFVLIPYDKYERMMSNDTKQSQNHDRDTTRNEGDIGDKTLNEEGIIHQIPKPPHKTEYRRGYISNQNGEGDQLPPQPPPGLPNKKRARSLAKEETGKKSKKRNWKELWQTVT